VVELAVIERQRLGPALNQLDVQGELAVGIELRLCAAEHLAALVQPDDRAAIAAHERGGDHACARGHVKNAVGRLRAYLPHHRPAPARILAEAEQRARQVVAPR
jgi:hypothetical protein